MLRGRRIAFDYGDVRIGVAVSDLDSILCSPLTTLKRSDKKLKAQLAQIFAEINPVAIYVGKPLLLSGHEGGATTKASEFAELLSQLSSIPVEFIDERLSTVSAARNLREAGKTARAAKDSIDMAAAISILEFAIEIEKKRS